MSKCKITRYILANLTPSQTRDRALASRFGPMARNTLVYGSKAKHLASDVSFWLTVTPMKGSGKRAKPTDMECIITQTGQSTRGNGLKISSKALGRRFGPMGATIRESTRMVRSTEKEGSHGQMGPHL